MSTGDMDSQRVALITGGAAGIGRAIVERFARDGWIVVFGDRDVRGGRTVMETVVALGARGRFVIQDLANRGQRARLIDSALAEYGRIDVLINNAATVGARIDFLNMSEADWNRVLEINLTAAAFLARDAGRHMTAAGSGAIINIAAIQEWMPLATHVPYVASKGGVSALTRALAVELSPAGVRVNAVAPGVILSPGMAEERENAEIADSETMENQARGRWPTLLPRPGYPSDVAGAAAYLASEDAAFVTGTTITVDGGRRLSRRPDDLATAMESVT